jgi:hypothetical protein
MTTDASVVASGDHHVLGLGAEAEELANGFDLKVYVGSIIYGAAGRFKTPVVTGAFIGVRDLLIGCFTGFG